MVIGVVESYGRLTFCLLITDSMHDSEIIEETIAATYNIHSFRSWSEKNTENEGLESKCWERLWRSKVRNQLLPVRWYQVVQDQFSHVILFSECYQRVSQWVRLRKYARESGLCPRKIFQSRNNHIWCHFRSLKLIFFFHFDKIKCVHQDLSKCANGPLIIHISFRSCKITLYLAFCLSNFSVQYTIINVKESEIIWETIQKSK